MPLPSGLSRGGEGSTVTVVIGYGRTGSSAVPALRADTEGASAQVVVVERRHDRVAAAKAAGLTVVAGEATDIDVLRRAGVPVAKCVVVTCMQDATTAMVLTRVRSMSGSAKVVVAVRTPEHIPALRHAGADLVVLASRITDGLLALTVAGPVTGHAAQALLAERMHERRPRPEEVGAPVRRCEPMVLAVLRDGTRHWCDDPELGAVQAGDVLIGFER